MLTMNVLQVLVELGKVLPQFCDIRFFKIEIDLLLDSFKVW